MFKKRIPGPKNARSTWHGFPFQLFLFTILPLSTLLIVIAFGSLTLHQQAMRSLVGDRDLRAVRAAANSLSQEIAHREVVLQFIQANSENEQDAIRMIDRSQASLHGFDQGLAIFSPQGQAVYTDDLSNGWPQGSPDFQKTMAGLFAKTTQGPTFLLSEELKSRKPLMLTALRLSSGDFLVGAFNPAAMIQNGLNGSVAQGQTTAYVVDANDQVVYQEGSLIPEEQLSTHPGIQEALRGESGINFYPTPEGEHVVAFSPIEPTGWALMIEEPWESIDNPMLRTTQEAPFVLVPLLILALVSIWFGVRRIAQPLQALEGRAAELAGGDFQAIQKPVGGIPEIQRLQAQLISMAEKLNAAQEDLHRYIGAITSGIENERRNLARELHDDTIQALIALNQRIQLETLENQNGNEVPGTQELQPLVQQAMVNLRRIIRGLRPIYLEDLGLVAALGMLAQEVSQASELAVDFQAEGSERRLEAAMELALYRIAQEALSNAVRHANAKNAWIRIEYQPTSLRLSIRDNGTGFVVPSEPGNLAPKGHFGLVGLRERAELIGASLIIDSALGKGTTVSIRLDSAEEEKPGADEVTFKETFFR